jgi:hypothetical protein
MNLNFTTFASVCKLPVAKRNFVKRHGHGIVHSAKELRETIDCSHPINQGQIKVSSQTTINITALHRQHTTASSSSSDAQKKITLVDTQSNKEDPSYTLEKSTQSFSKDDNEDCLYKLSRKVEIDIGVKDSDHTWTSKQNYEPVPDPLKSCNVTSSILDEQLPETNLMEFICMDNFFNLPYMDSESMRFVGSEKRDDSPDTAISIDFTQVFD